MESGDADTDSLESVFVNDMVEFAMFASRNQKNYRTAREFKGRQAIWKKS